MRLVRIMIIILIAAFILFLFRGEFKKQAFVKINNITFNAEVAKTDEQKEVGLSKYEKIEDNYVLVFPFKTPGTYAFWMKDMKFPIDIIFVNKNKIVDVYSDVPPPKNTKEALPVIKPKQLSDTVLEINAGLSRKYKFKKGDLVQTNY